MNEMDDLIAHADELAAAEAEGTWPSGTDERERFELHIAGRGVQVRDRKTGEILEFSGPQAMEHALAEQARLKAEAEKPAKFLTEELPAVAQVQRREGELAEAKRRESDALAVMVKAMRALNEAVDTREVAEERLQYALSQLNASRAS